MHITILTSGSHGDVRPYIALALGLEKAGHKVRIVAPVYEEFIKSFGLEFVRIGWKYPNYNEYELKERIFNIRTFNEMAYLSEDLKNENGMLTQLWEACQGTEAIIYNITVYPCYNIAEKLGIPCYLAAVQPHHQTSAFYYSAMPYFKNLGTIYNWLSYPLFDQLFWLYIRKIINKWRKKTLKISPLPYFAGILRYLQQRKIPALYGYSPSFLPKPAEWGENIHVTGYWFLDTSDNWEPPTNLINFLSEGPPPIFISRLWHPHHFTKEVLLEIAALTGQRIIVHSSPKNDLNDTELPDQIFCIKGLVAHDWLFPKMALLINHAGLGTMMTALRAGVPSIVIPSVFLNDQEFWAVQLAQSGLGINFTIPEAEKLSVQNLVSAINIAIQDQAMKTRVVEMSKKIQAEDGVQRAIEAFHHHLIAH